MKFFARLFVCVAAVATSCLAGGNPLQADLLTVEFSGVFGSDSALYSMGDTYGGFFTYDTSVSSTPHPDNSLNEQYVPIRGDTLPGTGWDMTVNSSTIGDFQVGGNFGTIAYGNDNSFGFDRYIATLYDLGGPVQLPNGLELNFFQFDMSNNSDTSRELLNGDDLTDIPNLANASNAGGRFFILNPPSGCSQCFHNVDVFRVPEPGSIAVLACLASGVFMRRRR